MQFVETFRSWVATNLLRFLLFRFVLDTAFETYSLDRALYPLPCRWGYVTAVPDLKIYDVSTSAAPQAAASAAAESPKEAVTSSARNSIEKFTAKVSSATLFEESLLK